MRDHLADCKISYCILKCELWKYRSDIKFLHDLNDVLVKDRSLYKLTMVIAEDASSIRTLPTARRSQ